MFKNTRDNKRRWRCRGELSALEQAPWDCFLPCGPLLSGQGKHVSILTCIFLTNKLQERKSKILVNASSRSRIFKGKHFVFYGSLLGLQADTERTLCLSPATAFPGSGDGGNKCRGDIRMP